MQLEDHLRRQRGVLTRRQAGAMGLSAEWIRRRTRSGAWSEVLPGVLAVGVGTGAAPAFDGLAPVARVHAVALWLGPAATLGGPSAAWWWSLVDQPPPTVRMYLTRRVRPRPGVSTVRRPVADVDRRHRQGVAVLSLPAAALDAAGALGSTRGGCVLDEALRRGACLEDLRAFHYRTLGRHGSSSVTALLRAVGGGARSEAERRMVRALRSAGITGGEANARLVLAGGLVVVADLAFRAERVVVEIDGRAWHTDAARFEHDRRRQNALVLAGWTVLRFTWRDLEDPHRVVDVVARALTAARSPTPRG